MKNSRLIKQLHIIYGTIWFYYIFVKLCFSALVSDCIAFSLLFQNINTSYTQYT